MLTAGTAFALLMANETGSSWQSRTSYPQDCTTCGGKSLKLHNAIDGESKEEPMAHGGGGAPPCGCWNASRRCIVSNLAYRSGVLRAGQGSAWQHGSLPHYGRDYRAPSGRALQLIMNVADRLDALSGSLQPRAASVDGVPRRFALPSPIRPRAALSLPLRLKPPAAVFAKPEPRSDHASTKIRHRRLSDLSVLGV
jgi:hypothetical protein